MSIDKEIFRDIPQLWIQQFSKIHFVDYLLIESYCTLCFFLAVVFLGLLLFNKKDFRKLILAFFIAPFLAMPFWYVLPAVSPDDMYRKNLYSLKSILPIQKQFEETSKGEKLSAFLNFLEQMDTDKTKKGHPLISTNPSMHVAWGEIITYYSIILWWPLCFVFMPWLILNIISTVYTMQHYVIDLPCGLICGAIAIIITNSLFKFEKKYYTGTYIPLYFISIIQADVHYLKTKLIAKLLKKS
jgi:membrane-associated phospholipid phosphatase